MYTQKDIEDECREIYLQDGRWEPTTKHLMTFFSKKLSQSFNEILALRKELDEFKESLNIKKI